MKTPDGEWTVKARLLMCSVDLPARAAVLNMIQYNGEYGCCFCEDKGAPRPTSSLQRNWPFLTSNTRRTHRGIISNAKTALEMKMPVSLTSCMNNLPSTKSLCVDV